MVKKRGILPVRESARLRFFSAAPERDRHFSAPAAYLRKRYQTLGMMTKA